MPSRIPPLCVTAMITLVALQCETARAEQDIADYLFPPSVALSGVARAVVLGSAETPTLAPPNADIVPSGIWNGASWLTAWMAPAAPGATAQLRASGISGSFVSERQVPGATGDGRHRHDAVMTFNAPLTHTPESRLWSLILAGIFVMAAIVRRHMRKDLPD